MREFVKARGRGDRAAMQHWWRLLLTEGWDHVITQVDITGRKVLWSDAERGDALSEAGRRLAANVVWNFNGTTTEEFVGALRTTARISCLDVQRDEAEHGKRVARSLDAPTRGEEGDTTAWADAVYADLDRKRAREDEDRAAMEAELQFQRAFRAWALPQLSEKRRRVIELLLRGLKPVEIMEQMGITRDDVDQTKRRVIQDLRKLMEQYRKEQNES